LNNITAGVRERGDANRTREAGHLDEIQGVVASTLKSFRNGAVGFIDWLGVRLACCVRAELWTRADCYENANAYTPDISSHIEQQTRRRAYVKLCQACENSPRTNEKRADEKVNAEPCGGTTKRAREWRNY